MARNEDTRREKDALGEVRIPEGAYWGAHTQRALENFGPGRYPLPEPMRRALGLIKRAAAEVNGELETIPRQAAEAVAAAAAEIEEGDWSEQFPVDVFQTGSGTSWNMNVNEVIACRAREIIREDGTERKPTGGGSGQGEELAIHPNDTVNRGQSSNDVIPTAMLMAARREGEDLLAELRILAEALGDVRQYGEKVLKLGRTHLQDAVPMTVGQEVGAWQRRISEAAQHLEETMSGLELLPLGGTAVGTGINSSEEFASRTVELIAAYTGFPFREAPDRFAATASREECLRMMAALDGVGAALEKIAEDLRLLVSGPRAGLAEYRIPELQPGSSVMPGKANPVLPEMVLQTAVCVAGKYAAVRAAAVRGPLQLNIMQPLIAHELLKSIALLTRAVQRFTARCITGLRPDEGRCSEQVERSLALVTPLALRIGYERSAEIARTALREGLSLREAALRDSGLSREEIEEILDPERMAGA